jgi:hypothetical protein
MRKGYSSARGRALEVVANPVVTGDASRQNVACLAAPRDLFFQHPDAAGTHTPFVHDTAHDK